MDEQLKPTTEKSEEIKLEGPTSIDDIALESAKTPEELALAHRQLGRQGIHANHIKTVVDKPVHIKGDFHL